MVKTKGHNVILILGGVRSGKSAAALEVARNLSGPEERIVFIATGSARDDEMKERIRKHKQERPSSWITIEAGTSCGKRLSEMYSDGKSRDMDVVILDCLTMLAANILMEAGNDGCEDHLTENLISEINSLVDVCSEAGAHLLVVSNEVGMGVVPPSKMGRLYRDLLGKGNKHMAAKADKVFLMIAGLMVDVKRLSGECGNGGI